MVNRKGVVEQGVNKDMVGRERLKEDKYEEETDMDKVIQAFQACQLVAEVPRAALPLVEVFQRVHKQ